MLNPFGFAQAKLREASRSSNVEGSPCLERDSSLPAVAQNDIGEEPAISSEL